MKSAAAGADRLGKYTLVAKLATGGMAEIFLARLQGMAGFEKLVCIKRILPHMAKDQQLVNMFLSEARIAAQISHPNVCQVFELGEVDGSYFIAMEYLAGVPLSCFRRRDMYPKPIDPRLVAALGIQACEGLHHAHQLTRNDGTLLEVVHRDVSANNLFATVDGVVKVLDFGIAKVQDASVRTSTGSVKGTYAYMAPEQLRGERVDRRTDVFALGAVLWEMFSRGHLFKRETDFLTFQAITSDPIPDVAEFRPDVPPALAAVIAKALERKPDDRFPTARAMGEALAQSVGVLGGPLSASAISEEITTVFEPRLGDQRELIRIARDGGSLSLEEDLGPAVGHGTEMLTTPLSIISRNDEPSLPPRAASVRTSPPSMSTSSVAPMPIAPSRGSGLRIALIAIAALVAGGAGVYAYLTTRAKPAASIAAGSGSAGPVAAVTPPPADAPAIEKAVPVDAAVAEVVAAPADAAEAELPADAAVVTPTPPDTARPKPRPAVVKPVAGPPGFITIDSSPVYAVIFIDGKRYGETPLVHVALAPGKHAVRAVSASGTTRTLSITIESGKVAATRRIEW